MWIRILIGSAVGLLVYAVIPKEEKAPKPLIISPPPLSPPTPSTSPGGSGRMQRR